MMIRTAHGETCSSRESIAQILTHPLPVCGAVHIHLVGIGGAGLSAIAKVLLQRGFTISGSDLALRPGVQSLVSMGATVHEGHSRDHITGADLVLVSSAVPAENAEVEAARLQGIPVVNRAEFLGWLTAGSSTIAVAGTHGKTTTTAMIALALARGGLDPSYVIGGDTPSLEGNAHSGAGEHFVIEADEYDRTFLGLRPDIAVVTTVEWDHVDCYPTVDDCVAVFQEFEGLLPHAGLLIACADDSVCRALGDRRRRLGLPVVMYGLSDDADWQAARLRTSAVGGTEFQAVLGGEFVGTVALQIPGRHNVANALAALAVAHHVGVDFEVTAAALESFVGVRRRFERKGEQSGVIVLDDYAHHPTEIRATLSAARQRFPAQTIWAVFQPHTFSRTGAMMEEFASSFTDADHVVVTDIFAARERDSMGVSAVQLVRKMSHQDARHIADLREVADFLQSRLRTGDVLITLGAGDGYQVGEWVLAALASREDD